MTYKEYQDKKREYWENVKFALRAPNTDRKVFDFIFDRAYALGKQENDAEDTVISGWVARDESDDLFMYHTKPVRDEDTGMWYGGTTPITPSNDLFPDLTWDSEPIEVELIIKRKKE